MYQGHDILIRAQYSRLFLGQTTRLAYDLARPAEAAEKRAEGAQLRSQVIVVRGLGGWVRGPCSDELLRKINAFVENGTKKLLKRLSVASLLFMPCSRNGLMWPSSSSKLHSRAPTSPGTRSTLTGLWSCTHAAASAANSVQQARAGVLQNCSSQSQALHSIVHQHTTLRDPSSMKKHRDQRTQRKGCYDR